MTWLDRFLSESFCQQSGHLQAGIQSFRKALIARRLFRCEGEQILELGQRSEVNWSEDSSEFLYLLLCTTFYVAVK